MWSRHSLKRLSTIIFEGGVVPLVLNLTALLDDCLFRVDTAALGVGEEEALFLHQIIRELCHLSTNAFPAIFGVDRECDEFGADA